MTKRKPQNRGPIPLPLLILLEVAMIGVALVIFALFHHVIPQKQASLDIISARPDAPVQTTETQLSSETAFTSEETENSSETALTSEDTEASSEAAFMSEDTEASSETAFTSEDTETSSEAAFISENEQIASEAALSSGETEISTETALMAEDAQVSSDMTAFISENEQIVSEAPTLMPTPPTFTSSEQSSAEVLPEATPAPTEAAPLDATLEPVGYFGTKFRSKFCEAGGAQVGNNYQGVNTNVTLARKKVGSSYVCVADIYIRDISNLITVLANDTYGRGITEWVAEMSERKNGIVAINGDYYGAHSDGIVIRNGTVYRSTNSAGSDVCALYWDGVMETYTAKEFNLEAALKRGIYQAWCFGPALLDKNGKAISKFNSSVSPANPRAGIGYYEPGHYCFVVVEGRSKYSEGMTLKEFSATMEALGCTAAYNLDGGATAMLVAGKTCVNKLGEHSRPSSDAIIIINE